MKLPFYLTRFLGLSLSLALSLPSPAFALRTQSAGAEDNAPLNRRLTDALLSDPPVLNAGAEERLTRLLEEAERGLSPVLTSEMEVRYRVLEDLPNQIRRAMQTPSPAGDARMVPFIPLLMARITDEAEDKEIRHLAVWILTHVIRRPESIGPIALALGIPNRWSAGQRLNDPELRGDLVLALAHVMAARSELVSAYKLLKEVDSGKNADPELSVQNLARDLSREFRILIERADYLWRASEVSDRRSGLKGLQSLLDFYRGQKPTYLNRSDFEWVLEKSLHQESDAEQALRVMTVLVDWLIEDEGGKTNLKLRREQLRTLIESVQGRFKENTRFRGLVRGRILARLAPDAPSTHYPIGGDKRPAAGTEEPLEKILQQGAIEQLAPMIADPLDPYSLNAFDALYRKIERTPEWPLKRRALLESLRRIREGETPGQRWSAMVDWINTLNEVVLIPKGLVLFMDLDFPASGGVSLSSSLYPLHGPNTVEWWEINGARFPVAYAAHPGLEPAAALAYPTGVILFSVPNREEMERMAFATFWPPDREFKARFLLEEVRREELRHMQMGFPLYPALIELALNGEAVPAAQVSQLLGIRPESLLARRLQAYPKRFGILAKKFSPLEISAYANVVTEEAALLERLQQADGRNGMAIFELQGINLELSEQLAFKDWPKHPPLFRQIGFSEVSADLSQLYPDYPGKLVTRMRQLLLDTVGPMAGKIWDQTFDSEQVPLINPARQVSPEPGEAEVLLKKIAQFVASAGMEERRRKFLFKTGLLIFSAVAPVALGGVVGGWAGDGIGQAIGDETGAAVGQITGSVAGAVAGVWLGLKLIKAWAQPKPIPSQVELQPALGTLNPKLQTLVQDYLVPLLLRTDRDPNAFARRGALFLDKLASTAKEWDAAHSTGGALESLDKIIRSFGSADSYQDVMDQLLIWMNRYLLLPAGVALSSGLHPAPGNDIWTIRLVSVLGYELIRFPDLEGVVVPVVYVLPGRDSGMGWASVRTAFVVIQSSREELLSTRHEELGHAADQWRLLKVLRTSALDPIFLPSSALRRYLQEIAPGSSKDAVSILMETRALLRELAGPQGNRTRRKLSVFNGLSKAEALEKGLDWYHRAAGYWVFNELRVKKSPAAVWKAEFFPEDKMRLGGERIYPDENKAREQIDHMVQMAINLSARMGESRGQSAGTEAVVKVRETVETLRGIPSRVRNLSVPTIARPADVPAGLQVYYEPGLLPLRLEEEVRRQWGGQPLIRPELERIKVSLRSAAQKTLTLLIVNPETADELHVLPWDAPIAIVAVVPGVIEEEVAPAAFLRYLLEIVRQVDSIGASVRVRLEAAGAEQRGRARFLDVAA